MKRFLTTNHLLILLVILAACLRLYGLNWDQGYHLHPDERQVTMVAASLRFPDQLNPHFFAYGSFPIYLLYITGHLLSFIDPLFAEYAKMNLVGRGLSALFDLGTLITLYFLAKTVFNKSVGLISVLFYALSVLPIQLSHFYTVDPPLSFLTITTLYLLIRYLRSVKCRFLYLAAVTLGIALATKASAVVLLAPVMVSLLLPLNLKYLKSRLLHLTYFLLLAGFVFAAVEPYAIIDFPTFWRQTLEQQSMTKDAFAFPYTFQYVGKIPYLYELKNIYLWGLGPVIASLAFAGILLLTFKACRSTLDSPLLIINSFFWLYFFIVGSFAVGFMRYVLPLYPLLCLAAAYLMFFLYLNLRHFLSSGLLITVNTLFIILVLIWPLSFIQIYNQKNTRVQATDWIRANIPNGSTVATEHWDDELPLGGTYGYQMTQLTLYDPDTLSKWQNLRRQLQTSNYLILASNRLYAPLQKLTDCPKLPADRCYPQTAHYYRALFSGQLLFTKAVEFNIQPTIPLTNFVINDFNSDESFTVYDHPKVLIFKNEGRLTSDQLRSILIK